MTPRCCQRWRHCAAGHARGVTRGVTPGVTPMANGVASRTPPPTRARTHARTRARAHCTHAHTQRMHTRTRTRAQTLLVARNAEGTHRRIGTHRFVCCTEGMGASSHAFQLLGGGVERHLRLLRWSRSLLMTHLRQAGILQARAKRAPDKLPFCAKSNFPPAFSHPDRQLLDHGHLSGARATNVGHLLLVADDKRQLSRQPAFAMSASKHEANANEPHKSATKKGHMHPPPPRPTRHPRDRPPTHRTHRTCKRAPPATARKSHGTANRRS